MKVLSNMMVDLAAYVDVDPKEVGVTELVYYPALRKYTGRKCRISRISEGMRSTRISMS